MTTNTKQKFTWTILGEDTRANAGARSIIKRSYRRWLKADKRAKHANLERWARSHPLALLASLTSTWKASKRAWEDGNNSGDSDINRQCSQKEVWKAEDHDVACSVLGLKVDWPGLAPCYHLPGAGDYYTTESALSALVPNIIRIEGRLWWRQAGHHIWSARVFINGRDVLTTSGHGGGSNYLWETFTELEQRGLVIARDEDKSQWSPWRWCESQGILLNYESETVKRKKDLHE